MAESSATSQDRRYDVFISWAYGQSLDSNLAQIIKRGLEPRYRVFVDVENVDLAPTIRKVASLSHIKIGIKYFKPNCIYLVPGAVPGVGAGCNVECFSILLIICV